MGKFKTFEMVDVVNKVFKEYKPNPKMYDSLYEFDKECDRIQEIRKEIINILRIYGRISNDFFEFEEDLRWVLDRFPHGNESQHNYETYEDYEKHEKNYEEFAHRIKLWILEGCIGDIFSYEEFYKSVEDGGFIDYDGRGEFMDNDGKKLGWISCDCEWLEENKPEECRYVMWYNK